MTNLHTDEIVFFRNLTKIGTDENKAIYSSIDFPKVATLEKLPIFRVGLVE